MVADHMFPYPAAIAALLNNAHSLVAGGLLGSAFSHVEGDAFGPGADRARRHARMIVTAYRWPRANSTFRRQSELRVLLKLPPCNF